MEKLTGDISLVNCDTFSEKNLGKVVYPSSLKHVVVPGLTIINADNVYFTGSVPPEVTDPDNAEDGVLPVYCHIHVPAAYEDAYKAWYQKYEPYSNVDGWHTYHPETGI